MGVEMGHERARYDAVRQRVFAEVNAAGQKYKLLWNVPVYGFVLAVLLARGEGPARLGVHALATALVLGGMLHGAMVSRRKPDRGHSVPHAWIVTCGILLAIANTGGLTSPLVPLLVPAVAGASMVHASRRLRAVYLVCVCLSFGAMGLARPLGPVFSSGEAAWLAGVAVVYAVGSLGMMSGSVACAYERVAMELAARRDQICDENKDRSMALEGVAARLAHEVKNPLAAIKGLSAHLARTACDERMAERLAIVAGEADRLQAIVDSYLTFSRGLDDLKPAPTRPYQLARELSLLLETRAAETSVSIEVRGDEGLVIDADARKLRQALLNLILNAMQASPAGSKVAIEVWKAFGGGARLLVVDEGHGMSKDVLDRIKKPYFSTREGGTGLGIAVARGLVEQHGGALTFASAPGRGTTAMIELHAAVAKERAAEALPNPARPALHPEA